MPSNSPFDTKDFSEITKSLLASLASGENGRPALTDNSEGSVIRTLSEAFARELAVCYQQLRYVYNHGFLDTAEGIALDNVVALLGVTRQRAGHIEGNVVFSRPQPATADIPIPASTLVSGRNVPLFATTEAATLRKDTNEVTVKVRSVEPSSEPIKVASLNLMPRPIWGIDTVCNTTDLLPRQGDESDDDLRERTRHLLQKANLGTSSALEQAVRALGINQVLVREDAQRAGVVDVVLGDTDINKELLDQAKEVVQNVRPAGIRVNVFLSQQILVGISATLVLRAEATAEQKQAITEQITQGLKNYFSSLKTGELVLLTKIKSILTAPNDVAELLEPKPILGAFIEENDKLNDASSSHLANNGDIRIEGNERALLDLVKLPLSLSLEPPELDVWLDVIITHTDDAPSSSQTLTEQLRSIVNNFSQKNPEIGYQTLFNNLGLNSNKIQSLQFRLLHSQTNLSIELNQATDKDSLKAREKLRVGRVDFKQVSS